MSKAWHLGKEPGLDRLGLGETLEQRWPLGIDEHLDRVNPGLERRLHEVFTLTNEEPEALALTSGGQAAHELQARIRSRGDHADGWCREIARPWRELAALGCGGRPAAMLAASVPD
jgi:hypothetical protein